MVAIRSLLRLFLLAPLATAYPTTRVYKEVAKRAISRDSNPGLMGSGTYPRATFRADGSILSCYTSFSGGNNILTVASSTDGGWNWSIIGSVATETSATHDLDNCNVQTLSSGRILAAFRNHDRTSAGITFYRIVICYSDDNGANWLYLSTPLTSGTPGLGLWEPFLQNTLDGSLQLYYSYETSTSGNNQNNYVITSTDGGLSFGAATLVSSCGSTTCRDGMTGVARLGSGSSNLIAVFESLAPDSGIHAVFSTNDGVSWGSRTLVYQSSVSGADQAAPQVAYINGQLVTSFQTNEDTLTTTTADWNVKVVVSTNGGTSWAQETTVLDACNWAGELTVDSTHLLVMCSSGGDALSQTMLLS